MLTYVHVCALQITATEDVCIVKDGTYRKLIIKNCKEEDAGKYRCEADGRKTEAVLLIEGIVIRCKTKRPTTVKTCTMLFSFFKDLYFSTRSSKNQHR